MWNEQCIEVYKAWSLKKKHWKANDPKRITKAKHRLITALRRSPEIEMLQKESTFYRFRILHPELLDDGTYEENLISMSAILPNDNFNAKKCTESSVETENCVTKDIRADNKEQRDILSFNSIEISSNLTHRANSYPEVYDIQKVFPMPNDILIDEFYQNETKSVFSDKCCCIKLLDFSLCNQKCIWHGIPP